MVGQSISNYRIIGKLGQGGMGVVYLAEHVNIKRRVAIKTLKVEPGKQDYRQRFLREACILASFNHPNIAHVYDYGKMPDGNPYIIMELVEGQTLKNLISQEKLALGRTLEIIGEVAKALAEAHRNGIVHRDIKPSNVIVNERDEVKVVDFGLAKNVKADSPTLEPDADEQAQLSTVTGKYDILGTPAYLSPEQALGRSVDARSDIFSLGALLYECITGVPAFQGKNGGDIRSKVVYDDPPPPSKFNTEVPPELDSLTLKALSKKAPDRFQSADEFRAALTGVSLSPEDDTHHQITVPVAAEPVPPVVNSQGMDWRSSIITAMRQPRHLAAAFILTLALGFIIWGLYSFHAPAYQQNPQARYWYTKGLDASLNSAFYESSKMLEESVRLDGKYAPARARWAQSLFELGYTDRAAAEIARATDLASRPEMRLPELEALHVRAISATVSQDHAEAVERYREILQLAPDESKAAVLLDLGRAYEKSGDVKKAIESYEQAAAGGAPYAAASLRAGVLYGRQQEFTKADDAFNEAARIYNAQSNMEGLTEVMYQRGILLTSRKDVDKARGELERALDIARTNNNVYQQIKISLQLSQVLSLADEPAQAKALATEAINSARSQGILNLATEGLIELGNAFLSRREIAEAESYFKQALEQARANGVRVSEARALLALGSLYVQQDDADHGLEYLAQALPFYQRNGFYTQVMLAQSLAGQAYNHKGDYQAALHSFEQLLEIATRLGNQAQMALAHKGASTSLIYQGRYTEAIDHLKQSYSIYNTLKRKLDAEYSHISQADALWRLGRYDEARAALAEATGQAQQPDGTFKQLWVRIYLAEAPLALSERRFEDAILKSDQAIKQDDSHAQQGATEATSIKGLAQTLSGMKEEGRRTCEKALAMAESSQNPRLIAEALLTVAVSRLESGDATGAAEAATMAQQTFARLGRVEAEWRAWLVAGQAKQRLHDDSGARAALGRADGLLSSLRQLWGDEAFNTYLSRPDVTDYRRQLTEASAAL